jgi:putative membrane protein
MMYWYDGNGEWWMWLFMIIFWVVVISFVVWAVRRFSGHPGMSGGSSALDIAKERYAKGEISHEEFEKIKKNLS